VKAWGHVVGWLLEELPDSVGIPTDLSRILRSEIAERLLQLLEVLDLADHRRRLARHVLCGALR
jgi:hypothetical protein